MSEAEKKKPDAPPPSPPSAGGLLEQGLVALVDAPGAFARLAARPASSAGASVLAGLAWGLAFFGLNLAHAAASGAAARFAGFPAWQFAAVGAVALGAWASLLLLGAAALYALGRAVGGAAGDFDRALQLAALTAAAGVFQALGAFVPVLWFLPLAAAAWIASCGLIALFGAGAAPARAACALLAGLGLGAQYAIGSALEARARLIPPEAPAAIEGAAELQKQFETVQAIAAQTPQSAGSGLDLLRGPGEEPQERELTLAEKRAMVEGMRSQGDAMNKSVLAMLDSMAPMLNNPSVTARMTPTQKADYGELASLIADLRKSIQENRPITAQEQQAQMLKIQQLTMRVMSSVAAAAPPAAAPAAKERKK